MKYQSYDEYLRHPLFRAVRAAALRRANGVCEECRIKRATEVHHWRELPCRYPVWGAFDTTTNLRAICHECHCKEHGVER